MKKFFLFFIGITLSLATFSQDENGEGEQKGWREIQVPFTYQNIQVPREFWDFVKQTLRDDGVDEKTLEQFAVLPVNVGVEIFSEDPLVLRDTVNYRMLYTEGGGTLDLFNHVVGKGTFFLRFAPRLMDENPFHLFYISDSPGKKVDGDSWGNGCGRIFDLTAKAGQFLLERGVKLTSARKHYLHLAAGIFVFFQLVEERLFLGYIRVSDSRYPQFKCANT